MCAGHYSRDMAQPAMGYEPRFSHKSDAQDLLNSCLCRRVDTHRGQPGRLLPETAGPQGLASLRRRSRRWWVGGVVGSVEEDRDRGVV